MIEVMAVGLDLVGATGAFVFHQERFNQRRLAGAILGLNRSGDSLQPAQVLRAEANDFVGQSGAERRLGQFAPENLKLVLAAGDFRAETLDSQTPRGLRLSKQG